MKFAVATAEARLKAPSSSPQRNRVGGRTLSAGSSERNSNARY
jgi:hypothetical protein